MIAQSQSPPLSKLLTKHWCCIKDAILWAESASGHSHREIHKNKSEDSLSDLVTLVLFPRESQVFLQKFRSRIFHWMTIMVTFLEPTKQKNGLTPFSWRSNYTFEDNSPITIRLSGKKNLSFQHAGLVNKKASMIQLIALFCPHEIKTTRFNPGAWSVRILGSFWNIPKWSPSQVSVIPTPSPTSMHLRATNIW